MTLIRKPFPSIIQKGAAMQTLNHKQVPILFPAPLKIVFKILPFAFSLVSVITNALITLADYEHHDKKRKCDIYF